MFESKFTSRMKKITTILLGLFISFLAYAQNDGYTPGFKKENLYVGAGINLGFFQGWILGLNPEVGYSVTRFMDVGLATNFNYITQNLGEGLSYRFRALGAGPYARLWIANQFFVTGQYEYNFIRETIVSGGVKQFENYQSPSFLVGGGWGSRFIGQSQFYTSIMIDVQGNENSPYIDRNTQTKLPVFRTGFLFYLPSKQDRVERRKQREEQINQRRRR
jgi:hypothetical protein